VRIEEQTPQKTLVLKETGLRLQISIITTLHSIANIIGRTHVSNHQPDKHALPITITKSRIAMIFNPLSTNVSR
jgi:hypothetical protein